MASTENRVKVWPLLAGIALVLQAMTLVYNVILVSGQSGALTFYVFLIGLLAAAMAGFLQKSPAAKYLQMAGAVLLIYRYGTTFFNYLEAQSYTYLPTGLVYGYLLLALMWAVVLAAAFLKKTPKALVIVQGVMALLMALMMFQFLGGRGILNNGLVQVLLYIVSALGLLMANVEVSAPASAPAAPAPASRIGTADELLKYKELLDKGILTQEEYEEKKRQLLGL